MLKHYLPRKITETKTSEIITDIRTDSRSFLPQSFISPKDLRGQKASFPCSQLSLRLSFNCPSASDPRPCGSTTLSYSGSTIIYTSPDISLLCFCRTLLSKGQSSSWTHSSNSLHLQGPLTNTPAQSLYSRPVTL